MLTSHIPPARPLARGKVSQIGFDRYGCSILAFTSTDVLVIVAVGLIPAAMTFWLPLLTSARAVVGLPFLLAGQGYVLTRARFCADTLSRSARLTLSLAFSGALIMVVALNAAGASITARSLIPGELAVTIGADGVAVRPSGAQATEVLRFGARALERTAHLRSFQRLSV